MSPETILLAVVDALDAAGVPYLLTGSFASIYRWCDQHGTRDLFDEIRSAIPPLGEHG